MVLVLLLLSMNLFATFEIPTLEEVVEYEVTPAEHNKYIRVAAGVTGAASVVAHLQARSAEERLLKLFKTSNLYTVLKGSQNRPGVKQFLAEFEKLRHLQKMQVLNLQLIKEIDAVGGSDVEISKNLSVDQKSMVQLNNIKLDKSIDDQRLKTLAAYRSVLKKTKSMDPEDHLRSYLFRKKRVAIPVFLLGIYALVENEYLTTKYSSRYHSELIIPGAYADEILVGAVEVTVQFAQAASNAFNDGDENPFIEIYEEEEGQN